MYQASPADFQYSVDIDPTAYYPDFWNYAAYYGEAAARQYYTTWSPPEGFVMFFWFATPLISFV